MIKRRGHPVRGAISGLLFGILLAISLSMFKVSAPNTLTAIVAPVAFAVLGIVLGLWAPFGKGPTASAPAAPPPPEPANVPAEPLPPSGSMGAEAEPDDA